MEQSLSRRRYPSYEYFNVYEQWVWYSKEINTDEKARINFERNMESFEENVNEKLDEGWTPLGPPTFSSSWLCKARGGLAIQTLIRDKNIQPAVVVEVNPPIVAANVKALRFSERVLNQSN
jgi:hypothetical protein